MAASADKFARLSALRPALGRPSYPASGADISRGPQPAPQTPAPQTEEECMLARMIGATVAQTKFGSHLTVRSWHATPEFCPPSPGVIDLLHRTGASPLKSKQTDHRYKNPGLAVDPEKWLFLDTETTGLSGGTGTYAFLIGVAWWDSGGLQVEQFLMRDFSEEHSVLLVLAERLAERPVLVTFNGKTFDWPLLESRYTMTRSIRVPQLAAHLDLLHPARAVWKLRLGSVRLMELERHVLDAQRLGWDRADDVPSNMIPQFYFDYLRGRSVAPLAGVVRHNRNDLRGLAALFAKLNKLLGNEQHGKDHDGLDLFGLSRFLQRRGEAQRAESACSAARELGLPIPLDLLAQWELARMAKRRGQHEQAAEIWQELTRDEDWRAAACEELAIYHQRRSKNFKLAIEFARRGLQHLRRRSVAKRLTEIRSSELRLAERLQKRIARLQQRAEALSVQSTAPLLQIRSTQAGAD